MKMFSGLRGVIREVPYGNDEFSSGYPCEKGDLRIHRAHLHRFCRGNRLSGEDFMDKYEAPEIHRQNEQIKD